MRKVNAKMFLASERIYAVNHHIVFNKFLNSTEFAGQPVNKHHKAYVYGTVHHLYS